MVTLPLQRGVIRFRITPCVQLSFTSWRWRRRYRGHVTAALVSIHITTVRKVLAALHTVRARTLKIGLPVMGITSRGAARPTNLVDCTCCWLLVSIPIIKLFSMYRSHHGGHENCKNDELHHLQCSKFDQCVSNVVVVVNGMCYLVETSQKTFS